MSSMCNELHFLVDKVRSDPMLRLTAESVDAD